MTLTQPQLIEETDDFAIIFKPAKMHCIPHAKNKEKTLLDWYQQNISINRLKEAGLIHRLDYETHGLVLFAKNNKNYNFFRDLQDNGEFIKEYSAICKNNTCINSVLAEGFPPLPVLESERTCFPVFLESYFRPYGTGRKQVRPVINDGKKYREVAKDKGGFYLTEIIGINGNVFTVRIKRGFRHQIRCHLCWIGFPILNDPLYNPQINDAAAPLALRAHALFFIDPSSGKQRECRIEPFLT